jgi:hypothetical protein
MSAAPTSVALQPAPTAVAQHLHLIVYSEAVRAQVPTGWLHLDNLANPRPDWFEYWPIRQYLLNQPLDEQAFYGFFSPKFCDKTQLNLAQVQAFVQQHAADTDVFLFSPQPDMGAFFLNVFEQGETFDPGLIAAYEGFLGTQGLQLPLKNLVMDSRQVCFSNYFIAKPAFWRAWLQLNEAMFRVCEGPDSPLKQALNFVTTYPGPGGQGVQRKVFLQERAASLLLTLQPQWRTRPHNPFGMGWSTARFREHPMDAFASDALKRAWRDTGWPEYLNAFVATRQRFLAPVQKAA